jgi:hypothetical protein
MIEENTKTNNDTYIKIGAVVGMALLLFGAAYLIFIRPRLDFDPQQANITCKVEVSKDPAVFDCKDELGNKVELNSHFTREKVDQDYVKGGNGFKLTITKMVNGKPVGTLPPFELPVKTDYREMNPARKSLVVTTKTAFDQLIKRASSKDSITRVVDFFLDDTSGVDELTAQKVGKFLKDYVADAKTAGDKLDLSLYLITDSTFVTTRNFKSTDPDFEAALNKELADEYLKVRPQRGDSSIASTLVQALARNKGREYREVILVTDGIENVPGKVSLLPKGAQRPLLMDRAKWNDLANAMFADYQPQMPDLTGATVTLYALPSIPKSEETAVQNAFSFWTERFFVPAGAAMQSPHFER